MLITRELIERINYLARKDRFEGLEPAEKEEQQRLRQQYLKAIRTQVVDALDSAGFPKKHDGTCSCPTCHHPEKPKN